MKQGSPNIFAKYLPWTLVFILAVALSYFIGKEIATQKLNKQNENNLNIEKTQSNKVFKDEKEKVEQNYSDTKNANNKNQVKEKLEEVNFYSLPLKVQKVYDYVVKNNSAPEGYVGGRVFQNREKILPFKNENGERLRYREWDVNPKIEGQNRGAERLVTDNENIGYYTNDHYRSFKRFKR